MSVRRRCYSRVVVVDPLCLCEEHKLTTCTPPGNASVVRCSTPVPLSTACGCVILQRRAAVHLGSRSMVGGRIECDLAHFGSKENRPNAPVIQKSALCDLARSITLIFTNGYSTRVRFFRYVCTLSSTPSRAEGRILM